MSGESRRKKCFSDFLPALFLCIAMDFMLFIYAPLEMFFYNKNEFWFDITTLFPVLIVIFTVFLAISLILFALLFLIHGKAWQVGLVIYFIAYICTYIQGNFLARGLPSLAGDPIYWALFPRERMKCIVMWIVVTAMILILTWVLSLKKMETVVKYTAIFVTLVLLLTVVTVGIQNDGLETKAAVCVTKENEFQMSGETNYIVLVMDALDSRQFGAALNAHENYRQMFEDFTYYPNTVCGYGHTREALPFILSGQWYENERDFTEYMVEAYRDCQFFAALEERGYRLGMYDMDIPLTDECVLRFENVVESEETFESIVTFAKYQMMLVGYKYAPFDFKRYCEFNQGDFWKLKQAPEGTRLYQWNDNVFYEEIKNQEFTFTQDKCFKWIHLEGAHSPYVYDKDLNGVPEEEGSYDSMVEACYTVAGAYLDKLRQAGIYDDSVIIIMADHGFPQQEGGFDYWNPAFLVKGINEHHELNVSNAPLAYEDLRDAFLSLLDGSDGTKMTPYAEDEKRPRRYMYYEFDQEEHMYEAVIDGFAGDVEAMTFTGREYHRK